MSLITLVEFWWLQMTFRDAGGSKNHTNFARLFELIWLPEDTKEMISVNHILVFVDVVISLVSNYCLENKSKVTFCATFFVLTLIILKGNIKLITNCQTSTVFNIYVVKTLIWMPVTMVDGLHLCWLADMVNKMLSNYFQIIFQVSLKWIDFNVKDNGEWTLFMEDIVWMPQTLVDRLNLLTFALLDTKMLSITANLYQFSSQKLVLGESGANPFWW